MAQGLFFLSLFFVTFLGALLLRPDPIHSITRYSEPARMENRVELTRKMATFLKKNPKIVEQKELKTLPLEAPPEETGPTEDFQLQGQLFRFRSESEENQWILRNLKDAPCEFVDRLREVPDPDTRIALYRRILALDSTPTLKSQILDSSLKEAALQIQGAELTAEKYLRFYLEQETDPELGKSRVDEVLKLSNKPRT